MSAEGVKVVLVPGNGGGGDIRDSNFYGYCESELLKRGYDVRLPEKGMPDPFRARESIWVPHIVTNLGADESTILIGHSSGAVAGLRLAEEHKLLGLILVGAYDDPLGDKNEAASGYFSRPWRWEKVRENVQHIVQIAGGRDQFLPIEVQRRVGVSLGLSAEAGTFIELATRDHFMQPPFEELLNAVEAAAKSRSG